MSNQGMSLQEIASDMAIFKQHVDDRLQFLFEKAAFEISTYVYFYKVRPTDGIFDEYKGIYFTGTVLAEYFSSNGLVDLGKNILIATLMLLDVKLDHINARREVLTTRLLDTIRHGKVDEHLGKYGLYLIYKCSSNSVLDERSKKP